MPADPLLASTGALLRAVQRDCSVALADKYLKAVQAFTWEQVNGAIKQYFDPHPSARSNQER